MMYAKHLSASKSVSSPNTSKLQHRWAVCNRDLSGSSLKRTDGSQPLGKAGREWGRGLGWAPSHTYKALHVHSSGSQ